MRLILIGASLVICGAAVGQGAKVWVASPWEHVLKSAPARDGQSVELRAARNEYEPFRVIVTAGDEALSEVAVTAEPLRLNQRNEAPLTLYREHYINCFEPSRRSTAEPGWYPDALVPLTEAFDVAAGESQGVWVDAYVPADATPGTYEGELVVTAAGEEIGTVSVALDVWDFALPETFAMRSNFGSLGGRLAKNIGMDAGSDEFLAIEDAYIDELLAHRCQPSSLGNIWPKRNEDGTLDDTESGERLRHFVEDRHINSLKLPFPYGDGPEKCKAYLANIAEYLREKGWLDLAYIYMKDEPNDPEEYEIVREQGRVIREADAGIRRMCTEQTITSNEEWGDLYGAVDVWCPLWGLYDDETALARQAAGEEIWSYTALCQCAETNPYWQIDFPPVVYRSPFWVSWHYDITGFLYWSSIYLPPEKDVWDAPHFRDQYWGEGMLLYHGQDVGIDGPVSSIRLKLIREAMEDFEYMTLAANAGKGEQVDRIVDGLATSFQDWERDPGAYMDAREEIAGLIVGG